MAAFDNLLSAGFSLVVSVTGAPTITAPNGQAASGVATPVGESRELREAGYWPAFHCVFEMTRADYLRLKLHDRSPVIYREAGEAANSPGRELKVIGQEPDSADPCIRITLKEDPKPGVKA